MSQLGGSRPALASLVTYFVAAKKALATTDHVYRANEVVSEARRHLEYLAITRIANTHLSRQCREALASAEAILYGLKAVAHSSNTDFERILQQIDDADTRLSRLVTSLRTTTIDPALRPENESARSLHDFIDTGGTNQLHEQIKESIDHIHEAQGDYDAVLSAFGAKVQSLAEPPPSQPDLDVASRKGVQMSPVVQAFHLLEGHAAEMADLLQSLVRHYDLCITALRHTEGGGQALRRENAESTIDFERQTSESPEPMSEAERDEMIQVLEVDAAEVDDVVREITERLADMESHFAVITAEVDRLSLSIQRAQQTKSRLADMRNSIDDAVHGSERYDNRWRELCARLVEKVEEFDAQHQFYDGFVRAYDGLLVEIGRRKKMETEKQRIVRKATAKLDRLWQEDSRKRDDFRIEFGEYLPSDIWTGLSAEPTKPATWTSIDKAEALPDIDESALGAALERLQRRTM